MQLGDHPARGRTGSFVDAATPLTPGYVRWNWVTRQPPSEGRTMKRYTAPWYSYRHAMPSICGSGAQGRRVPSGGDHRSRNRESTTSIEATTSAFERSASLQARSRQPAAWLASVGPEPTPLGHSLGPVAGPGWLVGAVVTGAVGGDFFAAGSSPSGSPPHETSAPSRTAARRVPFRCRRAASAFTTRLPWGCSRAPRGRPRPEAVRRGGGPRPASPRSLPELLPWC